MATPSPFIQPGEPIAEQDGVIHGVTTEELRVLGEASVAAKARAYCPYSFFRVGASLLLNASKPPTPEASYPLSPYPTSHILTGANVENASYPVGTCAERVALGTAVHMGYLRGSFKALAVSTDIEGFCSPCGMCRQFLREFLSLETPVFMFNNEGKYIVRTMEELLPLSFGPDVLPPREELRKVRDDGKVETA